MQKYEVLGRGSTEDAGDDERRRRQRGRAAFVLLLSSTVKECPASKQAVSSDSTSRRPVGQSASQSASQRDAAMRDKARGEPLVTSLLGPDKDGRAEVSFSSYFKQGGWYVDGVPPVPERRHQHPAPCSFPAQPVGNKESQHATDSICLQRGPGFREPRLVPKGWAPAEGGCVYSMPAVSW